MDTSRTASAARSSLMQDWLNALRYWLRGRNGVIALIVLAVVIGAALGWSWLVAVGIAPLLLAFAPCAAMCALGLCASRMGGGSCSKEMAAGDGASQAARSQALPAAAPDPSQLTLDLDDGTAARPALVAPAAPKDATETPQRGEDRCLGI